MAHRWLLILLSALAAGATVAGPCPPIEGLDELLVPGRVLLLGEMHGTEESPAFALDVACHAARKALPVILGLELAPVEQERVDEFLSSKGTAADREALIAGRIWQQDYQDGRNSLAMYDLIDGARRLRREGFKVDVALFDASGAAGGQQRDRAMARNLAAVAKAAPESVLIVLTGNMHSRVTLGTRRNADYEPMGHALIGEIPRERVIALDVAHGGGSAWICSGKCGVQRLGGRHGEQYWVIEIDEKTRPSGHDGRYHVGGITASPPASRPELAISVHDPAAVGSAKPATEAAPPPASTLAKPDDHPLTESETKLQGHWQAFDFGSNNRLWKFRFDERSFRAEGGTDDWYEGRIVLNPEKKPAQIDFAIEDCRCDYKGQTSSGIYYWKDDSLVVAAPRPGSRRPPRFNERNGEMMQLQRIDGPNPNEP